MTSQLFANLYLNELDIFVKHVLKIRRYARYSDDLVIIHTDRDYLESLVPVLESFVEKNLRLQLHPKKIIISRFSQGVDFLGYVLLPHAIIMRTKTKRRMLRLLRTKIKLLAAGEISRASFHQTVQSYLGILKHCKGRKIKRIMKDLWNHLL